MAAPTGPIAHSRIPAMEGVASCAISSRGIMPSDSIEMIRYRTNTAANPSAVERPTSRTYFARPEITTAPSMPVKTHTRAIMVETACSPNPGPAGSPQKLSIKISTLNLPRRTMLSTKSPSGTSFANVTIVLMPAASLTPRSTRAVRNHRNTLAQTMESRLFPAPNAGKK